MREATDPGFCRLLSRDHAESLVASAASDTWLWLVLEYGGPWAAKAYDEAVLPAAVRRSIDGWLAQIPGARVQLIRRRSTPRDGEVHVFVAWTRPEHRVVRRVRLPSCDDVASLDVPGFVAAASRGEEPALGEAPERPIVLVCTNGRRDRCCAKWGVPVYRALSQRDDLDVWQTTHLGGHRFAATLLTLPDGLSYGRVEPDEVDALAQALHAGEIHRLDRFRGRTALPAAGQAAEHFFRARSGQMRVDAVRGVELETIAEGTLARVRDDQGVEHPIALTRETLPERVPPSCGKPPEPLHRWTTLA
jgi:hypothetical protein